MWGPAFLLLFFIHSPLIKQDKHQHSTARLLGMGFLCPRLSRQPCICQRHRRPNPHTKNAASWSQRSAATSTLCHRLTIVMSYDAVPWQRYFSEIIGWYLSIASPLDALTVCFRSYFLAWVVSFVPQLYANYTSKSVIGLSLDFVFLNIFGYLCYSANLLAFSPFLCERGMMSTEDCASVHVEVRFKSRNVFY